MATVMPEGDAIRNAVKWISAQLDEKPDQSVRELINKAALNFNLSPLDTEFLVNFYRRSADESQACKGS